MAALAVAAVLVGMAVVAGVVVLVASAIFGRDEADPTGRRAGAIYLAVVSFIAVSLALFSSFGVVVSLTSLIGPRGPGLANLALPRGSVVYGSSSSAPAITVPATPCASCTLESTSTSIAVATPTPGGLAGPGSVIGGYSSPPALSCCSIAYEAPSTNDQVASVSLALFLVFLAALGLLGYHRRRLSAALAEAEPGPVLRVMTTYRLGVSLVGVFVTAVALVGAAYGVFRIIAPGVSGASGRGDGVQELIDAGYLALAGAAVVYLHRRPTSTTLESPDVSATPD